MGGPVYVAMSPHGRAAYPNLLLVPRAPAAGRGRLQRQVRRAFMVYGPELPASTIYECARAGRRRSTGGTSAGLTVGP
jgi:hypothetical protein